MPKPASGWGVQRRLSCADGSFDGFGRWRSASLESYYECVSGPEQHEERARMIDAITTNETRFFREPRQFEFLLRTRVSPLAGGQPNADCAPNK